MDGAVIGANPHPAISNGPCHSRCYSIAVAMPVWGRQLLFVSSEYNAAPARAETTAADDSDGAV
jgi:hypothetical protein